jgi:hypothetical protein
MFKVTEKNLVEFDCTRFIDFTHSLTSHDLMTSHAVASSSLYNSEGCGVKSHVFDAYLSEPNV